MALMAVKFIGKDMIEGLAIPFGGTFAGKDLQGEAFDAKTDLCIDWFGRGGRPFLYEHGLDGAMKTERMGRQDDYETREEGHWASVQLDMNRRYRKAVDKLIDEEALGFSSGAMAHLATKNARTGILTRWPWVELSGTTIPAEPMTLGVHYTKSIRSAIEGLEDGGVEIDNPLKAALLAVDDAAPAAPSPEDDLEAAVAATKAGRVLSSANRERLVELRARIAAASEHAVGVLSDLDELLTATDPEAAKALWPAVFEALTTEARWNGVEL